MPAASQPTDLDLAVRRTWLHADADAAGRVTGLTGAGLIAAREGVRLLLGDGLPVSLVAQLGEVVAAAHPTGDLADTGLRDDLAARLQRWGGGVRVSGGPVFLLPAAAEPSGALLAAGARLLTSADEEQHRLENLRPSNWEEDEWPDLLSGRLGPWAMAVAGSQVVSICHTPGRATDEAAECGVWTDPDHRGRGLAPATVAAWARVASREGRHLLYSTDADNRASQRVAAKLGARCIAYEWALVGGPWPEGDAWGRALNDHHLGRYVGRVELETGDGRVVEAMRPAWFFRPFEEWDWWERELLGAIEQGPVLDLGAGAGRAGVWLQERGFEVTAVESSDHAAAVCRRRGIADVRLGDLNDPPSDRRWGAVLLLCGNLGLGGTAAGTRALLARLAELCAPGAVLIGDSVDPGGRAEVELRIRYSGTATPWWRQYNIPIAEVAGLVEGTGWLLDRHVVEGTEHAVLLRRVDR